MSGGVTYLTMDYSDMCFQNNNWQFSSSKSQKVLPSWFHISLTCNTRNRKISRSEAGMSNMPCGESFGWRWPAFRTANALMFLACLNWTHTVWSRFWNEVTSSCYFFTPISEKTKNVQWKVCTRKNKSIQFILWAFKVCGI